MSDMRISNSATTIAELRLDGDFVFFDQSGGEILHLSRAKKGDPIHEFLATLLVQSLRNVALKDWRDLK
jgi:hypothetical protein